MCEDEPRRFHRADDLTSLDLRSHDPCFLYEDTTKVNTRVNQIDFVLFRPFTVTHHAISTCMSSYAFAGVETPIDTQAPAQARASSARGAKDAGTRSVDICGAAVGMAALPDAAAARSRAPGGPDGSESRRRTTPTFFHVFSAFSSQSLHPFYYPPAFESVSARV